jgi:predicted nucleic acid-binding Zn ribbon protein
MPTYEFRCPDGTIIERIYKMSEVPDAIPAPGGEGMAVRIISGGADLIFKGSGFYITDYGKDGKKAERAAKEAPTGESKAGAKDGAKDGAKTERGSDGAKGTSTPAPASSSKKDSPSGPSTPPSGAAA